MIAYHFISQAENLQFELVNLMAYEQVLQIQNELQATGSSVLAQFEQDENV